MPPRDRPPSWWLWIGLPLLCCGGALIPAVIGYSAVRLNSKRTAAAAMVYFAIYVWMFLAAGVVLKDVPAEDWRATTTTLLYLFMVFGGTVHAVILRGQVYPPPGRTRAPAPTRPMPLPTPRPAPPPPPPAPSAAPPPSFAGESVIGRIGPYALVGRLGEGGQGIVYLGRGPDGGHVAIKVLRLPAQDHAAFVREARAARLVPTFATARVLDVGVENGQGYLVSEYVDGPSLDRRVRQDGPLGADSLTRLALATAGALAGIHHCGIVHRDFKPANVLLGRDGPRVIDFGVAKVIGALTTVTGGTPSFMSPEQVRGEPVGPSSDVFSWAATMYFAATGRLAFDGPSMYAVSRQVTGHHPDLAAIPPELRGPLSAALDKDPGRRPSASDLMLMLSTG
ncbi:serine/threonine protein kinase [Nonomuraea sp. NN258]|uniref:serine/threonine-protein kinase n=1 Tax=Nonomuraea antri TaxID=2730852 RepID=UPI00156930F0|nr:serine/threonine-protein kinase [Nonomuraea antri]NRQ33339.1 serine/threonine protein kinase [Nonomuraea antri]